MQDPPQELVPSQIDPARTAPARASRAERRFQHLRDALLGAMTSGEEATAKAMYERALGIHADVGSMGLPDEIREQLDQFVADLRAEFPTAWRLNAARAAMERGGRALRIEERREHLGEARAVLAGGLAQSDETVDTGAIQELLAAVDAALGAEGPLEAGGLTATGAAPTELSFHGVSSDEPAPAQPGALQPEWALRRERLEQTIESGVDRLEAVVLEVSAEAPAVDPPTVEIEVHGRVHAAMLTGRSTPLYSATVEARGEELPEGFTLEITSEPPLIAPSLLSLPRLEPESPLELGPRRIVSFLRIDHGVLRGLTEVASGTVQARLLNGDGEVVASRTRPWAVHPVDSWTGLGDMPELLAAFVLPNDPAVDGLTAQVAARMAGLVEGAALDGYQSRDPLRALRAVEAVHGALCGLSLTYANPPASFESAGQRIRFPSKIVATRLATCLDLALLAAAMLEQAGLHAVLVLTEGHAMVAAWLVDKTFQAPVLDERPRFMKRVELAEIVVFDPVVAASQPARDFEDARAAAAERLGAADEFQLVIDVQRARLGGVRPLWMIDEGTTAPPLDFGRESGDAVGARDLDAEVAEYLEAERRRQRLEESPATRLDRWLRQLLDLTMRNRLLNASASSKRVLPLLAADVGAIEDRLSAGKSYRVLPAPTELDGIREPSADDLVPIAGLLASGADSGKLYSSLRAGELDDRILNLYREARTAREEGGSSSLYLAIGFLVYRETKQSTKERRAPLLLVPLELKRQSARKGYSLEMGADEPRVNVTLLEYLRRDHDIDVAGLDPLPEDENGVDVPLVLRIVKNAIKDEDHWRVEEALQIGLYSFAKYLLWRDLKDRSADLRSNALVEHLIENPGEPYPDPVPVPDPKGLDGRVGAAEVFAPLSYDSTQLSAILGVAAGATMVLEGPPGTGKSQTITNLIAHTIATGKTVLFVSEKMAALDVVQRRLEGLGLGPACLELHSNKANKKAVLAQFKAALDAGRVRGAHRRSWDEIAADVDSVRGRLNGHVDAMHSERTSGMTVHELITRSSGGKAAPASVELDLGDPRALSGDQLAQMRGALDELDVHGAEQLVGPDHPLLAVGRTETSPIFEAESKETLAAFDGVAAAFVRAGGELLDGLGVPRDVDVDSSGWQGAFALAAAMEGAEALGSVDGQWLTDAAWITRAVAGLQAVTEFQGLEGAHAQAYRVSPSTLDLSALESARREMIAGGWWTRWRRKGVLVAAVRGIAKDPKAVTIESATAALDGAQRLRDLEAQIEAERGAGELILGATWEGARTDLERARPMLAAARELEAATGVFAEACALPRGTMAKTVAQRVRTTVPAELKALRDACQDACLAFEEALDGVREVLQPLPGVADGQSLAAAAQWRGTVRRALDAWGSMRGWTRWQVARKRALGAGLGQVVSALESGTLPAGRSRPAFDAAFDADLLLHEVSADDRLRAFEGVDHGRAVERFRELDEERLRAAAEEVRQRVGATRPTPKVLAETAGASTSKGLTGLGLLQREITKKTRHLAIRRLLAELGPAAMELKPCFLMSPMSVAQYLDPSHPPFDLVVFDEASQIPVWDAIGALARGRQAVVVGDPKQLPPTSFFSRGEDETIAEDDIQDLESILEECMGAQVPVHRLSWHYRSRDESLIAFSNDRYYGGDLVTFPSNGGDTGGVHVRLVENGVYQKGTSRTNPVEAQAVVDEVVSRLQAGGEGAGSIGVVTFNQAQQQLVLDLFEEAQRAHPEIERYFNDSGVAGVFVKNLENVQGDERDLIIFSIGYGPDAKGRVSMNFGPLNKDGGERRLNVAITRARCEVLVFTSLRSDQIDLARTSARGVRDLRAFLRFAEDASREGGAPPGSVKSRDRLVQSIAEALMERGWDLDLEIGRSDVRLDLALRDPEDPSRYVLAIETDGSNYERAATARDRDRLRTDVLASLGWTVHRLWSVDWWRDREGEIAKIEAKASSAS